MHGVKPRTHTKPLFEGAKILNIFKINEYLFTESVGFLTLGEKPFNRQRQWYRLKLVIYNHTTDYDQS